MEKEITFEIKIEVMDMYRFMLRHAYRGFGGIVNCIISGGALLLLIAGYGEDTSTKVLLILAAALFTVINPVYLLFKAAKQVKLSPAFQKPLQYKISKEGIVVRQEAEELKIHWEEVRKVKETKKDIYIYLSLTRAYIFPKREISEKMDAIKEYLGHSASVNSF